MLALLALFLSVRVVNAQKITEAEILSQSYERVQYESATGKYENSNYLSSHKITTSEFEYTSTGDRSNSYRLSYAFTDNNYYWVSKDPNSATFHSSITITFKKATYLEAFLIKPYTKDDDGDGNTDYQGFPTKLKVYTSLNDEELSLHTIFAGTPIQPMATAQFVFKNPVNCTKLVLEFTEVTPDNAFSNGANNAIIKYINLIKSFGYDDVVFTELDDDHLDSDYMNLRKVQNDQLKFDSTGDKSGYDIDNAFDGKTNTYWVSDKANDNTFHSSIYVNFTEAILLDGFLIGARYKGDDGLISSRVFHGYPKQLNLYISNNNEPLKIHTKFTGTPSGNNEYFQFILLEPVLCSQIQLEFYDVTADQSFSNKAYAAVVSDIIILQNIDKDTIPFSDISDNYKNDNIVASSTVTVKSQSSSGDESKYPLSYAFDKKTDSYWISSIESSGTSHSYIIANFDEPVLLDAIFIDIYSNYDWWTGITTYDGFPRRIRVSTSLNNDDYTVQAVFVGSPEQSLDRYQLTLPKLSNCTSVKLEFLEVLENSKVSNLRKATVAGLTFLRKFEYEYLVYHENTGFDETHKIPASKIHYDSSGSISGNDISKAFDGLPETSWISDKAIDTHFQVQL